MKRCALYMRVSTLDQHPETQLYDLRQMTQQRGYQIVEGSPTGSVGRKPSVQVSMP
jgi:DNA invertase Pin-like site-specific DNA recombinase